MPPRESVSSEGDTMSRERFFAYCGLPGAMLLTIAVFGSGCSSAPPQQRQLASKPPDTEGAHAPVTSAAPPKNEGLTGGDPRPPEALRDTDGDSIADMNDACADKPGKP